MGTLFQEGCRADVCRRQPLEVDQGTPPKKSRALGRLQGKSSKGLVALRACAGKFSRNSGRRACRQLCAYFLGFASPKWVRAHPRAHHRRLQRDDVFTHQCLHGKQLSANRLAPTRAHGPVLAHAPYQARHYGVLWGFVCALSVVQFLHSDVFYASFGVHNDYRLWLCNSRFGHFWRRGR